MMIKSHPCLQCPVPAFRYKGSSCCCCGSDKQGVGCDGWLSSVTAHSRVSSIPSEQKSTIVLLATLGRRMVVGGGVTRSSWRPLCVFLTSQRTVAGRMSEAAPAKRKEKCENCTKQVKGRAGSNFALSFLLVSFVIFSQTCFAIADRWLKWLQCNKKNDGGIAPSAEEEHEANGEVTTLQLFYFFWLIVKYIYFLIWVECLGMNTWSENNTLNTGHSTDFHIDPYWKSVVFVVEM